MARVTVEDAVKQVGNRFDLVLIAARRARQISVNGCDPLVELENDKPTVIAIREIEEGLISEEFMDKQDQKGRLRKSEEYNEQVNVPEIDDISLFN
ncbi:MAG: DNA-directed RNA polymerase subunit omega [Succinivibrionaceae bacterium]|jgi:DNA-directed RNA polymerase subunit omega|nr:DNA-directed RNA polymerase subunit omega [Ruminobacter sp.]MDY5778654.1 DNA-directed RNA polymerase subunit omega [Succinivibrionaceae bacterium]MEE1340468.1 DNA-directed RNA polymerase subunit omega [Succinivibrionaceae bacterium]